MGTFSEIVGLSEKDPAWKLACIARDEKFGMHLTALVCAELSLSKIKYQRFVVTYYK